MRFDNSKPGERMTSWMSEAQEAVVGIVISSPRSADRKSTDGTVIKYHSDAGILRDGDLR